VSASDSPSVDISQSSTATTRPGLGASHRVVEPVVAVTIGGGGDSGSAAAHRRATLDVRYSVYLRTLPLLAPAPPLTLSRKPAGDREFLEPTACVDCVDRRRATSISPPNTLGPYRSDSACLGCSGYPWTFDIT